MHVGMHLFAPPDSAMVISTGHVQCSHVDID